MINKTLAERSLNELISAKMIEEMDGKWDRDTQCYHLPDGSCGYFQGATRAGPKFIECNHGGESAATARID